MKQCRHSLVRAIIFLSLFFPYSYLFTITIGSDSSVLSQPFTLFSGQDNQVIGFTYMDNGFALLDDVTTCSFNSKFPMRGSIALNGGTLYLQRDMVLDNIITLTSMGNIIALDAYALMLSSRLTEIGVSNESPYVFQDLEVVFNSDVLLHSAISFQGECILNGQGNTLNLGSSGNLVIKPNSHLMLKNIILQNLHDENLRCEDNSSYLTLDDVVWIQDDNFTFTQGSMVYRHQVSFLGSSTFNYTSLQTSTVHSQSQLGFSDNMTFCIGRELGAGNTVLEFEDESATLHLDNCTLSVPQSGLSMTKGSLVLDRNVNIDLQSTSSASGVIAGNGIPGNDITIYISPSAFLSLNSGYLVFNNTSSKSFKSFSQTSQIFRKEDSQVYVAHSLELPKITIGVNSNSVQPIQVAEGQTLTYKDTQIVLPTATFQITGQQYNPLTFLLNGPSDYLYITSGVYPLNLLVRGSINSLYGEGGINGSITLDDSSASLNVALNGIVTGPITLNGGVLNLLNDLMLRQDEIIMGPGIVDLGASVLELPFNRTSWATPLQWNSDAGQITLNGPVSLSSTWTINGMVTISGQGNSIELLNEGEIVIGQNGQLQLRNIQLSGLSDSNVRCIDNTGKITLNNTSILQDGAYSFSLGSIEFFNETVISGTQIFAYESAYTSTIKSLSQLIFDSGTTLNIGKKSVNSAEPLAFDDLSSVLQFDNSSLNVSSNGMRLTKGTVILNREVNLDMHSTSSANGLILGNGGNPAYDISWEHNPSSTVNFGVGHFVYEGSTPNGITSSSRTAKIVRQDGSSLAINQNLLLESFTIKTFSPTANLITAPGKTFKVNDVVLEVPKGMLQIKGQQIGIGTLRLNGTSDYANIIAGTLPLAMQVTGTDNTFAGSGNMNGPIVILNNSSILNVNFNGIIFNSIAMNGGSLLLQDNLTLGNDASLTGSGCVNINTRNVHFGRNDFSWTGTTCWLSSSGSLNLNSTLSLSGTWTIQGTCIVNGNGNTLNLNSTGNIVIKPNSQIIFRNITLNNVHANSFQVLDDNSVIVLDKVVWQQSENVQFTKGSMQFLNNVRMVGNGYAFAYQTAQTSTVSSNCRFVLDNNFTFSYDPIFFDSRNLLEFIDNTSQLILNGATLYATTTGMQLTKGMLSILKNSFFYSEVPNVSESNYEYGITLGNNTELDDFVVLIGGSSILTVGSGILSYRNVSSASFIAENLRSILQINSGSSLYLYYTLNLGLGVLQLQNNSTIGFAAGADIIGAVVPSGNFNRISLG